jgi:ATP-dependent Clp protease ATP-binding subunit ClpA
MATLRDLAAFNDEVDRCIEILLRCNRRNPLLISDTVQVRDAIVSGLAFRLSNNFVPVSFVDCRLVRLDMSQLRSEVGDCGLVQFRLAMVEAIRHSVILVLDNLDVLLKAGEHFVERTILALLMKQIIQHEQPVITGLTPAQRAFWYSSRNPLAGHFTEVSFALATKTKALRILKSLRESYEVRYRLELKDEALQAAVQIADQLAPGDNLIDDAIDIMTEACANRRKDDQAQPDLRELEDEAVELIRKMDEAKAEERYDEAARLQQTVQRLRNRIWQIQKDRTESLQGYFVDKERVFSAVE